MTPLFVALAALANLSASPPAPVLPAAAPPPAPPGAPANPDAPGQDKLALAKDTTQRLTIPVMIGDQGPFSFIIDTGADRTVISRELALALHLDEGPRVAVQNSGGVDVVGTAVIRNLRVGSRTVDRIEAPVLEAANLGAAGMLGLDTLRDQHVVLDFRARQLSALPSRREQPDVQTIVVEGKNRFGQLILVDAEINAVPIYVILDSGAQNSVGNPALQKILLNRANDPASLKVVSVTGRETPARFREVGEAKIGSMIVRNIPLAFADLATFHRFGLDNQPAMLLGMDVLGLCDRVTIDFARREASFTLY